jgi:dTDP-4-dehydrorhamnose reductase
MTKSPKSLFLFGGSGLMGTAVQRMLGDSYAVISPSSKECNIFHPDTIKNIESLKVDIIIYAVGYEPIDDSDEEFMKAYHTNMKFPIALSRISARNRSRFIFFSSDAVFPGSDVDISYNENSCSMPKSLYAFTKFGADSFIDYEEAQCYCVRMSRVFGPSMSAKKSPVNKLTDSYLKGESLSLVSDVYKSYTYSMDIVESIIIMLYENLPYGLYHIANSGKASMFDYFYELSKHIPTESKVEKITGISLETTRKSKTTLLTSVKYPPHMHTQKIPVLRSWEEALYAYCRDYLIKVRYNRLV